MDNIVVEVKEVLSTNTGVEAICKVIAKRNPTTGASRCTLLDGVVVEIPTYLILDLLEAAGVEYQTRGEY